MREVDPFDYWQGHSSAIEGLGGLQRSPDPRYLFHTRYYEVRAGRARFVVRLNEVRANFGELSVRVHAWKPESDTNISIVSGARVLLHGEAGAEVTLPVHFASQAGVLYALYGYLSEDSDVTAGALQVAIDEPEDTGELLPEPPRSVLAVELQAGEMRPANALLHYGRADTKHPVSQSCTVEQVTTLRLLTAGLPERGRLENNDAIIARWSETLCLNALDTYGATDAGLEGLVVGHLSSSYANQLARANVITCLQGGPPPPRASGDFFDFLLMPGGPQAATGMSFDARERWEMIKDWLALLKIGGLAVLGVRYSLEADLVSSAAASDPRTLSRNEIGQWTLRLIGAGYSVAPLAFAPVSELVVDHQGLAGFVLIIQRSYL